MPVTTPVTGSIVAIAEELLLQVPPPSYNGIVAPTHKVPPPTIAAGNGLTVTVVVVLHALPVVVV